jgi:hypothetical protein
MSVSCALGPRQLARQPLCLPTSQSGGGAALTPLLTGPQLPARHRTKSVWLRQTAVFLV